MVRPTPGASSGRPGRGLVGTAGGTFLGLMAFTAPISTVPSIAAGLGAGTVATSWILSSMSLGLAIALLTAGAIGDDFGRRRVFVWGAVLMTAGAVLCGVAPNAVTFIAGRVVEGIGAAAVIACGLAVISHTFPAGPRRAHATGIWGSCVGAGVAAGPLVGSITDSTVGWRYSYLILAVLSLALAVIGRAWLAESHSGRQRRIDVTGSALLGVGLGCLLAALTEGRQGWTAPLELVLIAAAALLLVTFVVHQSRSRGAMLDLSLFRRPALIAATIAALVTGAGVTALMTFIATVLETGLALSSVTASTIILGWSATSTVFAVLARRLPERMSGGTRMGAGLLVIAVGLIPLAALATDSAAWPLVIGLVVAGIGTGVLNATLAREAVASVPATSAGMGSGINNTSRYVGSALGIAIVTVIAVHPAADPAASLVAGWNVAVIVGIALSVVGAVLVLLLQRVEARRHPLPGPQPVMRRRGDVYLRTAAGTRSG